MGWGWGAEVQGRGHSEGIRGPGVFRDSGGEGIGKEGAFSPQEENPLKHGKNYLQKRSTPMPGRKPP